MLTYALLYARRPLLPGVHDEFPSTSKQGMDLPGHVMINKARCDAPSSYSHM